MFEGAQVKKPWSWIVVFWSSALAVLAGSEAIPELTRTLCAAAAAGFMALRSLYTIPPTPHDPRRDGGDK